MKRSHVTDFQLIDLVSQREAVREHLGGWSADDILAWLGARGQLSKRNIFGCDTFFFESTLGFEAVFFFNGDEMIFVADNTTFV